jgi:hypothetical protein
MEMDIAVIKCSWATLKVLLKVERAAFEITRGLDVLMGESHGILTSGFFNHTSSPELLFHTLIFFAYNFEFAKMFYFKVDS